MAKQEYDGDYDRDFGHKHPKPEIPIKHLIPFYLWNTLYYGGFLLVIWMIFAEIFGFPGPPLQIKLVSSLSLIQKLIRQKPKSGTQNCKSANHLSSKTQLRKGLDLKYHFLQLARLLSHGSNESPCQRWALLPKRYFFKIRFLVNPLKNVHVTR